MMKSTQKLFLCSLLVTAALRAEPGYLPTIRPDCFVGGCHTNTPAGVTAGLWINHINGVAQAGAPYSVTVSPGQSFTLDFRARGMDDPVTRKDPDISSAVKFEDAVNWTATTGPVWSDNSKTGSTPWAYKTLNYFVSNFPASESFNGKTQTTDDMADPGPIADKNGLASDEVMSVQVNPSVYLSSGPHVVTVCALAYHESYGATLLQVPIVVMVNTPVTPVSTQTWSLTPTISPTPTKSPTLTYSPTPLAGCPGTSYFGNTDVRTQGSLRKDCFTASKFNLAQPGTLNTLNFYLGVAAVAGQLRMSLYSDSGGAPGGLLAQGGPQNAVAGWNNVTVAATALSAGTYWIAWSQTAGGPFVSLCYFDYATFGDTYFKTGYAFGTFPGAAPAGGVFEQVSFSAFGAFCPNGTVTNTPSRTPTRSFSPSPSPSATGTPAQSPTFTRSPSPSATTTPSGSPSPSPTASPSASPSRTATPTPTPSATATWSVTNTASPSASPTPSASGTASPSASPTLTATPTVSGTATPSATPSITLSHTATPPFSPTPSATITESFTPSPSFSVSPTQTPTGTPTPSFTDSPTPTATPTCTPSATPSATPSQSPTATPTVTETQTQSATPSSSPSATPSASPTATPSATLSLTFSPSASSTPSPTATATSSSTPTASPSLTPSPSPTSSPSATPTPTATVTFSITATATATSTLTQSPTLSPSFTQSPTYSVSPSQTLSPTQSPSPTQGASATATPPSLGLAFPDIKSVDAVPNPVYGSSMILRYLLLADADEVTVRFFSTGMTKVWEFSLGARRLGVLLEPLALPAGMPNQLYYVVVETRKGDTRHQTPGKAVVVLR